MVFVINLALFILHLLTNWVLIISLIFSLLFQSIEIQKRIGAFSMALDTINKCLSEAICALSRGRLDGESRTAGLIHSGNEILETYKYHSDIRSFHSSSFVSPNFSSNW